MTFARTVLTVSLSLFVLAGCAARADRQTQSAPAHAHDGCVAPGDWFDPAQGRSLATPEAIASLKAASMVLLGETHVVPDHHRWHMQTVAQLYAQRPDMILGFESFPRRVQGVLDQWVAGQLTEAEFLKQSEWETVWRYDAKLYLPLFHFARLNKIPMVALNVDRSLIRQVSKNGWTAVPETERRGVGDPAPAPQGYVELLGQSFGRHGDGNGGTNGKPKGPGLSDPRFAGFVDVQVTWDRAMAEAAATALSNARAKGGDPQLIAIIGRGHLDYGYGVPFQLADLGIHDVKVLTPWDKLRACSELTHQGRAAADLAYGLATTKDYLPSDSAKPKLGVIIESGENGVIVRDVIEGSVAQTAGLKMNDLIVEAAGQQIRKTTDLIAIVQAMVPGTWLPLTIRRGNEALEIVARFPTEPAP